LAADFCGSGFTIIPARGGSITRTTRPKTNLRPSLFKATSSCN